MKLLFWTFLIGAFIWLMMKKTLGAGNDLVSHFTEQKDLQRLGDSVNTANQIAVQDNTLSTIGQQPLSGIGIDPLDPNNPFSAPFNTVFGMSNPSNVENGMSTGFGVPGMAPLGGY